MSGQSGPLDPKARLGGHVLAACGGIGGAKLALGLYRVLPPHGLTVVVNTGDEDVVMVFGFPHPDYPPTERR